RLREQLNAPRSALDRNEEHTMKDETNKPQNSTPAVSATPVRNRMHVALDVLVEHIGTASLFAAELTKRYAIPEEPWTEVQILTAAIDRGLTAMAQEYLPGATPASASAPRAVETTSGENVIDLASYRPRP